MIAVPRSSAARSACRARRQERRTAGANDGKKSQRAAHAPTNTAQSGAIQEKGASHRGEAPSCSDIVQSARDDQALAGHDHPAAVLLADGVDTAEAGNGIAGIDFVHAAAALDQRAAVDDVAQHPAFDRRQPGDLGLGGSCGWRQRRRRPPLAVIEPVTSLRGGRARQQPRRLRRAARREACRRPR